LDHFRKKLRRRLQGIVNLLKFAVRKNDLSIDQLQNTFEARSEWRMISKRCSPLGPFAPESQFFVVRSFAPVHRINVLIA
jgi:hypothetical protein